MVYAYGNKIFVGNENNPDSYTVFVYNMLGQEIKKINSTGRSSQGITINQASGIYIVKVVQRAKVYTQKVLIGAR